MANLFSLAEIVDIGIEKEKMRRDFYGAVAGQTRDAEVKQVFSKLRDWEEEHIRTIERIRESIDERETTESYPGEQREYMQTLVSDRLYRGSSAPSLAASSKTPIEAIDKGMEFEKDAILFFRALGAFLDSSRREVIDRLVRQEQEHLVYLSRLRGKLPGGSDRSDVSAV